LGKPPYEEPVFGPCDSIDPMVASIFYANDRYAALPEIESALAEGKIVVCDRYVESNMGHQSGKIEDAGRRREFVGWLEQLEYENFRLPKPDHVVFLHMPPDVAVKLAEGMSEKPDGHEKIEHLRKAEVAYLELADRFKWYKIECAPGGDMDSLKLGKILGMKFMGMLLEL